MALDDVEVVLEVEGAAAAATGQLDQPTLVTEMEAALQQGCRPTASPTRLSAHAARVLVRSCADPKSRSGVHLTPCTSSPPC